MDGFEFININDLGLCISQSKANEIKEIMGVMPYVAPELFKGGKYSIATDVYAFGILMPYHNTAHDPQLAIQICESNLRPQITEDIPQFYYNLMQKC
ncbi:9707_t:CDS:2 [Racocetra fulgida]|uniref:9707_t:CDS:1 n=1 Tax=Racocetra fulgida TaxID=60492 RepID=A0A9N9AWG1_9GLOM|nr:9707_t:CDS:2 [Racocetra fulgida]